MAYKILYSEEASHRYPLQKRKRNLKIGNLWVLLFLLIAALYFRLNGIPDSLIPGDPHVTRSAASGFMDNVQMGMQIGDAITVFCEQILDGAGT